MNDLEILVRQILREEIRTALAELLPRTSTPHSRTTDQVEGLLLTARHTAKLLSISDRTLYKLTQIGELPCVRVGASKRYSVEAIKKWIQQSENAPVSNLERLPRKTATSTTDTQSQHPPRQRKVRATKTTLARPQQSGPKVIESVKRRATARREHDKGDDKVARLTPFSFLLAEIQVDRADIPPISNGDLRRIAEVDVPTMHGWLYLDRPLPDAAAEKLRAHFLRYRKGDQ